jgi:hypothetical protein
MGTRSRIGVMHGNKCKSVYCHWDGYLAHNGAILQEHYDSAKANHLVALGDLSSLRAEIGEKHAFSKFDLSKEEVEAFETLTKNWCTFYGRDREEKGTEFAVDHTFDQFLERVENCDAEYYYIMRDGVWYCGVNRDHDSMVPGQLYVLSEALVAETVDQ